MNILVTGASGWIGVPLCFSAAWNNHRVTRLRREWANQHTIDTLPWHDFAAVVHLGAAGVKREEGRDWNECMEANFHALIRFFTALKVSRATPAVWYPRSIRETETIDRPALWNDAYVVTKKLGSVFVMEWANDYSGVVHQRAIAPCYEPDVRAAVVEGILNDISPIHL